jgi:hypothetical protein
MDEQRIAARAAILTRIEAECERQEAKWGVQNHPDGTNAAEWRVACRRAKRHCDKAAEEKKLTWKHILEEEVCEAFAEVAPDALIEELIQCAAVIVSWIAAIERRGPCKVTPENSTVDGEAVTPEEWADYHVSAATVVMNPNGAGHLRTPHITDDTFHRVRCNKPGRKPMSVDGVWCWVKV